VIRWVKMKQEKKSQSNKMWEKRESK
jgi:hypothetical protein